MVTVLESKRTFEGHILSVRVDRIRHGDEPVVYRETVEHAPAVCVLPLDRDGNVYLVRQYRHPVGRDVLEAPAGLMEEGETPEQSAGRELREETGATGKLTYLGEYLPSPGYCQELIHLFLADVEAFGATDPDEDEFLQTVKMPYSEFIGQCRNGALTDGKTLAVALRAMGKRGE